MEAILSELSVSSALSRVMLVICYILLRVLPFEEPFRRASFHRVHIRCAHEAALRVSLSSSEGARPTPIAAAATIDITYKTWIRRCVLIISAKMCERLFP